MMSKSAKRVVVAAAVSALGVLGLGGWWHFRTVPGAVEAGRGALGLSATTDREPAVPVSLQPAAGQFPPSEYPAVATERLIAVSLRLLEKNGADLSLPMPSRHRVLAADGAVVARLVDWARAAGYESTEPVRYHEHGGVEHFQLDLVRTAVPDVKEIEAQGREVFAAVREIPGAHYQTWEGAIVR